MNSELYMKVAKGSGDSFIDQVPFTPTAAKCLFTDAAPNLVPRYGSALLGQGRRTPRGALLVSATETSAPSLYLPRIVAARSIAYVTINKCSENLTVTEVSSAL
jgi:hypothetical protein